MIVYKVGYGFDPFIHEAAVQAIEKLGQIKPLTPYYLGQYSIVIMMHALTGIKTIVWAKLLVPGLASLILPLVIIRWLHHHFAKQSWMTALLFLFILPLTAFIVTTPQNLAYIFLLFVLFWPSPHEHPSEKIIVWLCAIAALCTQPIAGIPAVILALIDNFRDRPAKRFFYPLLIIALIVALPLAFYIFARLDGDSVHLVWPDLQNLFSWLASENPNRESWWLNFIYWFKANNGILIALLAICGTTIAFKKNLSEMLERFVWPGLALVASAIVTSFVSFSFLIDYERSNYPDRILITASLFFIPLILFGFVTFANKLQKSSTFIAISWIIIIAATTTTSLYLSYPRFDHYFNSHGYATSKADLEAVRWIDADSKNKPHIVLANQQVSAGALREFGFKYYHKNDLFYYPIPTGGKLYPYFLEMVEKPKRQSVEEAMELAGVDQAYFVLNSYWWEYKKLAAQFAAIADREHSIGGGQISVFVFTKK